MIQAHTIRLHRPQRSGVTLLEVMLVMLLTVALSAALSYAFGQAAVAYAHNAAHAGEVDETGQMEQTLTDLIRCARLSTSTTDTTTYFLSDDDGGYTQLGAGRLTFTTTAPSVAAASILSSTSYEDQMQAKGPQGGVAECSLALTAVGSAGDKTGLFERYQRPSDSDYTQGGKEFVIDSQVSAIGFEFWDGVEWQDTWNTLTNSRRLPQAVQVSYQLKDAPSITHIFVVPIDSSDVNAQSTYSTSN
jgi:Tfp pilus assembly protein PilE